MHICGLFFKIRRDFCLGNLGMITKSVDGCEILHQLIDGQNPIIYRLLTIRLVVPAFATIHSINHFIGEFFLVV